MKEIFNISLWEPTLEEYWYEQKLQSDPNTMDYNAGYDVGYEGYHYDNGLFSRNKVGRNIFKTT